MRSSENARPCDHAALLVASQAETLGTKSDVGPGIYIGGFSQADGKAARFMAARLLLDGQRDHGFGEDGVCHVSLGDADAHAYELVLDRDGMYLVGSCGGTNHWRFGVARLTAAGLLDSSFQSGGTLALPVYRDEHVDLAYCAIAADDGLYVAGNTYGSSSSMLVTRLRRNGDIDGSLAVNAVSAAIDLVSAHDRLYAVAHDTKQSSVFVVGMGPNGELDAAFGDAGVASALLGKEVAPAGLAVHEDRLYVAATARGTSAKKTQVGLVCFDRTGQLDARFGEVGRVWLPARGPLDRVRAIASDGGKLYIAGTSKAARKPLELMVARFELDGRVDVTFGNGGRVHINVGDDDIRCGAMAIADDKIYVAGSSSNGTEYDLVVARLDLDGTLDRTFGINGGIVWLPVGSFDGTECFDGHAHCLVVDTGR
jgi:uncharacterized delta-60 repeat protein